MKQGKTTTLGGLEGLLRSAGHQSSENQSAGKKSLPPVDSWNPPYCGDIGMAIRRDGTWIYQNSPIGRTALVNLFASVLRRDADGRHYLVTPVEKIDVAVDDAPFLAVVMDVIGTGRDQQLTFHTNVDDAIVCGADHPLRFELEQGSGGLKPYLLVRGRLEALVSRALYYDLVDLAVPSDANPDRVGLWSNGQFFEFSGKLNHSSP
jgi:uncharacterized protein